MKRINDEITPFIIDLYSNGHTHKQILEEVYTQKGIISSGTTLKRILKKNQATRSISDTLKFQNRKELPVDKIILAYSQEKLSLKDIGKRFFRNSVTIKKILIDNHVLLRERGEDNNLFRIKFLKPKLTLSKRDKAYVIGLVLGDFAVYRKSKYTLRISTASTKEEFIDMCKNIFSNYGHAFVIFDKYNCSNKITVDLDMDSFKFLVDIKKNHDFLGEMKEEEFIYFLAGFIDAEGTVGIHKRRPRNRVEFSLNIYNTDLDLLKNIKQRLKDLRFSPLLIKVKDKGESIYNNTIFRHNYEEYRITIGRKKEIERVLNLLPLQHPDKIRRKNILLFCIEKDIFRLDEFLKIESNLLHLK